MREEDNRQAHLHVLHSDDLEQLIPSVANATLGPSSAERWSGIVVLAGTTSEATSSSASTARIAVAPRVAVAFFGDARLDGVCAGAFGCGRGGGDFLLGVVALSGLSVLQGKGSNKEVLSLML